MEEQMTTLGPISTPHLEAARSTVQHSATGGKQVVNHETMVAYVGDEGTAAARYAALSPTHSEEVRLIGVTGWSGVLTSEVGAVSGFSGGAYPVRIELVTADVDDVPKTLVIRRHDGGSYFPLGSDEMMRLYLQRNKTYQLCMWSETGGTRAITGGVDTTDRANTGIAGDVYDFYVAFQVPGGNGSNLDDAFFPDTAPSWATSVRMWGMFEPI